MIEENTLPQGVLDKLDLIDAYDNLKVAVEGLLQIYQKETEGKSFPSIDELLQPMCEAIDEVREIERR